MSNLDELISSTEMEIREATRRLSLLKAMKSEKEMASWVTAKEAAYQLNISVRTIPIWCMDGRLEGKRPGRRWMVSQESIDRYMGGPAS